MIRNNRIRVKLDIATALVPSVDFFTGASPLMPCGRAVQFEFGAFNHDEIDTLNAMTSIKLEVRPLTASGVVDLVAGPVMSKTVNAADFNLALTKAAWELGFEWHVKVEFTEAETGLTVDALNYRDYGAVVTAQTGTGPVTLGVFTLRAVKDGGLTVVTPPPVGDPNYVRADDYLADKNQFIKRINAKGMSIILFNDVGSGIELRPTPGSNQPVLEVIKHNPPA
jgi:hypothetical protein